MKFGRTIKTSLYAEWADKYLQYSELKKEIKNRMAKNNGVWTDKDEDDFVAILSKELDKVYDFQKVKVSELTERIKQAQSEVNLLVSSRPNSSTSLPSRANSRPSSRAGSEVEGDDDPHRKRRSIGPDGNVLYAAHDAGSDDEFDSDTEDSDAFEERFLELEERLAIIIADVHDLALFTKLNYTGFHKIVKKHDKQTGRLLRKEFVQHYLSSRPFYKENYDQLIVKLSKLFDLVRTRGNPVQGDSSAGGSQSAFVRQTTKYWVHPDNIVPLKLIILKHLPVLVFNADKEFQQEDSAITSIYYDNEDLELYLGRLEKTEGAEAIRLRWYGGMDNKQIFVERKTHREDWTGEKSVKARFPIKEENVNAWMKGDYTMDETFEALRKKGKKSDKEIDSMLQLANEVQYSVLTRKLQPVMRSFYNRTAFQLPGDARVRISLDTELSLVREDNWDGRQRAGNNWRRMDIGIDYPFDQLPAEDIERFPYGVLEVKLQTQLGQEPPQWIRDLVSSHLVEAVPKFSKFIHGCATLLPNRVDLVPFWLPQMDIDIRKPPSNNLAIERPSSMTHSPAGSSRPDTPASRSGHTPYNEPVSEDEFEGADDDERGHAMADESREANNVGISAFDPRIREAREERERNIRLRQQELEKQLAENPDKTSNAAGGMLAVASASVVRDQRPSKSKSAAPTREEILAPSHRYDHHFFSKLTPKNIQRLWNTKGSSHEHADDANTDAGEADDEDDPVRRALEGQDEEVPRGPDVEYVRDFYAQPGKKVSVPIRIEPKVYFANERTFLKWLEFNVYLSALAVGLLNFSSPGDRTGLIASSFFTIVALIGIAYSGIIFVIRALKIRQRESSNIYFDAYGPTILCGAILSAVVVNFVLRFTESHQHRNQRGVMN
ncbi:putative vacuolar transporter chaperone [Mycosarcoma maydis]|uniref:Vacuolar transporter chaperone complex subunit 4 n=1 Tax=Mycosarcoma maydis TaxID=5270 RepID=A0A0D1CFP2_MYCMD|nr:putative vacuolar transporter chaperone [Ustilago maydis 521]KIS65853.1 putative vacuolar transporter chaperone [Ustilago maydis 521]|eukprot:XP_011392604.1 putative vacuolar transporter chaperone [Ustilago maydis 521]